MEILILIIGLFAFSEYNEFAPAFAFTFAIKSKDINIALKVLIVF
jgi:hypothetical protein